jgi:hypothetical protein
MMGDDVLHVLLVQLVVMVFFVLLELDVRVGSSLVLSERTQEL